MAYLQMLTDLGMNYTLNRPLFDGQAKARIKEVSAVAPQIKDFDSWHAVWLGLAKAAEKEQRWLDAATYYHQAEFYLAAGDARNALYDDFARTYALGMKGVAGYEHHEIPYPGGHLPGFRLPAKGRELATIVFHGVMTRSLKNFTLFWSHLRTMAGPFWALMAPGKVARFARESS